MKIGNLVYYVTKITGIFWIVKRYFPDCGCDRRRKKWNNLFTRKKDFKDEPQDVTFG